MPDYGGIDYAATMTISSDQARAVVILNGDLDIDTRSDLAAVIEALTVTAPRSVTVDVAAVDYAGSVLPNFLVQVRDAVPGLATLTVSRPNLAVRRVLDLTEMAKIAEIDDRLYA